jgi:hypothetical protein
MTFIAISGMQMCPIVAGRVARRTASRCSLPGHDRF